MYVCNIYRDKELELAPKKGVVVGGNRKAERSNSCSTTMLLHAMQFVSFFLCSRDGTLLYKERRVPPS